MHQTHTISPAALTIDHIQQIIDEGYQLKLSEESRERIVTCRTYLDKKVEETDDLFYGINTGFGSLCNIQISDEQIEQLQLNLIQSHAAGVGEEVPLDVVRLMFFLKIQSLAFGHSGVSLELVERLIFFFNNDIYPVIFQLGSLGASGDLAPLAHFSLPLLGMGQVWHKGYKISGEELYRQLDIQPLHLKSKEGLALLNGTQFSTAYGLWAMINAKSLYQWANRCAAISIDAFHCHLSPFDHRLHAIRNHSGQIQTAQEILTLLEGSELAQSPKNNIQDPYAFRCVPQVHGASLDAIHYVESVLLREVNAVTDNPNIFPDDDDIISGGNFHAQPIALALDFLAIALAELASISERRTYQLISGQRGLPPFLISHPGLNSGLMIPQYTAASIVSQNKQLCTPASVDSIISSNGQEDHVSMAANAATKLYKVVENVQRVLAIEWMTACQALDFRRPHQSSATIEQLVKSYRAVVPFLEEDRVLSKDIEATVEFISQKG